MKKYAFFIIVAAFCLSATLAGAEGNTKITEGFIKACNKKTEVWNTTAGGKIEKIGETLDIRCTGYLEGAFDALKVSKKICPKENITPEFIFSILQTYISKHPKEKSTDTATVVNQALSETYPCK